MNLEEIERALREVGVPIGPDLDAAAAIRTLAGTPPRSLDPGDPECLREVADFLSKLGEHDTWVGDDDRVWSPNELRQIAKEHDEVYVIAAQRAHKVQKMAQAIAGLTLSTGRIAPAICRAAAEAALAALEELEQS